MFGLDPELFDPPALEAELAAARDAMAVPPVLEELWRKAGGSKPLRDDDLVLLSPTEAHALWKSQLQFAKNEGLLDDEYEHGPCHRKVFDSRWIPFAATPDDGLFYCVDGYPTKQGVLHQVIAVHPTEGIHGREATDLEAFFGQIASELRQEKAAAAEKRKAADENAERLLRLREAVDDLFGRYRRAGVELGPVGELEEPVNNRLHLYPPWSAEEHALIRFLDRSEGMIEVRAMPAMKEPLRQFQQKLPSGVDGRSDKIAAEANRLLAKSGDPRRLCRVIVEKAPNLIHYCLLSDEQKSALEADGLVAFRPLPPSDGSGGLLQKIRRWLG